MHSSPTFSVEGERDTTPDKLVLTLYECEVGLPTS
jgi:hypothetical protein